MRHQRLDDLGYSVEVELKVEDLVWLSDLLSRILKEPGHDQYSKEDTEYILSLLENLEKGYTN